MSTHNPELQPPPKPDPEQSIQPDAADFVETPEVLTTIDDRERVPVWLYLLCGFFLFMAGSSFTGFGLFGMGLYDQGPGGVALSNTQDTTVKPISPIDIGKKVYANNCANCHHGDGNGQPGTYPPMGGSEWVIGDKARLAAILIHGVAGPLTVKGGAYGSAVMPAWQFPDDQMADLMTYLRASWGNTATAVTSEEVAAARAKTAAQPAACTESQLMQMAPHGTDPTDKKS